MFRPKSHSGHAAASCLVALATGLAGASCRGRSTAAGRPDAPEMDTAAIPDETVGEVGGGGDGRPEFGVPVACPAGVGCLVRNFVDEDPGPGARDFRCGRLTYDDHRGTDIRVPDGRAMAHGVAVLAAAPGTVLRIRDGIPDVSTRIGGKAAVEGHEAGNSVIIDHGGGWETQYGHLRRGSVQVAPGDLVEVGRPLGLIGLSGDTEFLHVHFEIRHDGVPIDPYTGGPRGAGCDAPGESLWTSAALAALPYPAAAVFDAGFADEEPDVWAARAGTYADAVVTSDSPALVFWVDLLGPRRGDRLAMRVVGPDGRVVAERTETIAEVAVQTFRYFGKKRPPDGWPPGRYLGECTATREEGSLGA